MTELTTPAEVMLALSQGDRVFCEWEGNWPMHTIPGEVIRCHGSRVLVRHWADHWFTIGDRGFRLVSYGQPSQHQISFKDWLEEQGLPHPNLGINWPAGDAWGAAGNLHNASVRYQRKVNEQRTTNFLAYLEKLSSLPED